MLSVGNKKPMIVKFGNKKPVFQKFGNKIMFPYLEKNNFVEEKQERKKPSILKPM